MGRRGEERKGEDKKGDRRRGQESGQEERRKEERIKLGCEERRGEQRGEERLTLGYDLMGVRYGTRHEAVGPLLACLRIPIRRGLLRGE